MCGCRDCSRREREGKRRKEKEREGKRRKEKERIRGKSGRNLVPFHAT